MKPHEFGVFLSKLGLEDDIRLPDDHLEVSYRATPSYHPLLFGIFHYKPSIFGEHPIKMDDFFLAPPICGGFHISDLAVR